MPSRFPTVLGGLGAAILIGWLLILLKFVFLPLVIAMFISFLLTPMVRWLTRRKVPQFAAVSLAMIVLLAVVYLTGTIILQRLVSFQAEFPVYEKRMEGMIENIKTLAHLDIGPFSNERLRTEIRNLSLSSVVGSTLNSAFSFLSYLLFTFVFTLYFLVGSPKLPGKIRKAFPPPQAETINKAIENISMQVQRYIWAKTLTSIITGLTMVAVCVAFSIDFAVTWGFFTFLLNFVPTIGVFVASLPPLLVAFINSGDWVTVFWAALVITIVFMALGNYIEPKILGESVNLSPLVALFSLIFWGWLWGPAGMIVAVPITAVIKFTFDHIEPYKPIGVMMGGRT